MGFQKTQTLFFNQWLGLKVKPRRINMRNDDADAVPDGTFSHNCQGQCGRTIGQVYLFVFLPLLTHAQSVDYNKIIVSDQVPSISFEERLVQLAWKNHPTNKVALQKVEMAQALKSKASWAWLDYFFVQANVNEFTSNTELTLAHSSGIR